MAGELSPRHRRLPTIAARNRLFLQMRIALTDRCTAVTGIAARGSRFYSSKTLDEAFASALPSISPVSSSAAS
ncbi:hypothetical protein ACIHFE_32980 [Streptomyces sp. NPDC052396]|uniref:hypothetical protein n=1 Tax=Streptomyces sp. NPDC052396 TaxID=3365689 RepID=UPI0037D49413